MSGDQIERVLREYCAALQSREPPPEQSPQAARYTVELNQAVRERADRASLLPDPATFRKVLKRFTR